MPRELVRAIRSIELPALVGVCGGWYYVLATHGELILDYASYDPEYEAKDVVVPFRGGPLTVSPEDGFRFLDMLGEAVFPLTTGAGFVAEYGERAIPVVAVDFDAARLTSSYFDQALERLCGDAWVGEFSDPLAAVPAEVAATFASCPVGP